MMHTYKKNIKRPFTMSRLIINKIKPNLIHYESYSTMNKLNLLYKNTEYNNYFYIQSHFNRNLE